MPPALVARVCVCARAYGWVCPCPRACGRERGVCSRSVCVRSVRAHVQRLAGKLVRARAGPGRAGPTSMRRKAGRCGDMSTGTHAGEPSHRMVCRRNIRPLSLPPSLPPPLPLSAMAQPSHGLPPNPMPRIYARVHTSRQTQRSSSVSLTIFALFRANPWNGREGVQWEEGREEGRERGREEGKEEGREGRGRQAGRQRAGRQARRYVLKQADRQARAHVRAHSHRQADEEEGR
jgi:hypothetical protein